MRSSVLALAALAASVCAAPTVNDDQSANPRWIRRYNIPNAQCNEQSCIIATLAGTTGFTAAHFGPNPQVTGDNEDGDCCVIAHEPQYKDLIYKYRPNLKTYCATSNQAPFNSKRSALAARRELQEMAVDAKVNEVVKRAACGPKTLFYSRGTFESGDLGFLLGPQFYQALGSGWNVVGVDYDATIDGDYCLGIPGALIGLKTLEAFVASCPTTSIVMGGYSQGAMVVRGALARASSNARKLIKGVITFGDPFEGSPILHYKGPIATFCATGDGVCTGHLDITSAHLSYSSNQADLSEAATFANQIVAT